MEQTKFEMLQIKTKNMLLLWKQARGIASDDVADKMDNAMLDWMVQLTDCLAIWLDKDISMTEGELILARANLGALVESWLKFFYCVYYEEYKSQPKTDYKGRLIEPNKMKFDELKQYSCGILWDDRKSSWHLWVETVQQRRNAIHAFNFKDIGTAQDFIDDVTQLYDFVEIVDNHLPPIEDFIECYPAGYTINQ